MSISRRAVLVGGASTPVAVALASCDQQPGRVTRDAGNQSGPTGQPGGGVRRGRLTFRPPDRPTRTGGRTGRFTMTGAAGAPPAELYVPEHGGRGPLRLVVMFHGAGGVAQSALGRLRGEAESHHLLLLAPKSTGSTWDVLTGGYGPDVGNLDRLLAEVAAAYRIRGWTIGGFSDGASYALSLGIGNGDVFDSVIAFSPGFEASAVTNGRPRFFVSHGTADPVLPIDRCSRRIVPALEDAGYAVTYEEFDGGHTVPDAVQRMAVDWLVA